MSDILHIVLRMQAVNCGLLIRNNIALFNGTANKPTHAH